MPVPRIKEILLSQMTEIRAHRFRNLQMIINYKPDSGAARDR